MNRHTSAKNFFGCLETSVGVVWCLLLSKIAPRYLEEVCESMRVKCVYSCGLWMRLRVYTVFVFECAALLWCSKCSIFEKLRKAKFTHLALFKYQNSKTATTALIEIFWSVRKKLLFGSPCGWLLLMLMFYGTHIDDSLLTSDSLVTANFKL